MLVRGFSIAENAPGEKKREERAFRIAKPERVKLFKGSASLKSTLQKYLQVQLVF